MIQDQIQFWKRQFGVRVARNSFLLSTDTPILLPSQDTILGINYSSKAKRPIYPDIHLGVTNLRMVILGDRRQGQRRSVRGYSSRG